MKKPPPFKPPSTLSAQQPRRPGHSPVMQPKAVTATQKPRQPVAPPVYRPQPVPRVLQTKKTTHQSVNQTKPAPSAPCAPLACRPQPTPKVLQGKSAATQPPQRPTLERKPVAPTAYRPQPVPRVLQAKMAGAQPSQAGKTARQPVAPPVYRPAAKKIAQPAMNRAVQSPKTAPELKRVFGKKQEQMSRVPTAATVQAQSPALVRMARPRLMQNTYAGGSLIQRLVSRVIQRQVNHDVPVYVTKNGRAGKVTVENICGTPLGPGANAPSVDVFGWPELWNAGHTLGNPSQNSSHYNAVRMHLWNGRLGGPGNDWRNLAPGPALINSSMSAGPEAASKDAVSKGFKIWLETEVWYQNNSGHIAQSFNDSLRFLRMEEQYNSRSGRRSRRAGRHQGPYTH